MQFAHPAEAALDECRRILLPGGRLVMTGWEALVRGDPMWCHDSENSTWAVRCAIVALRMLPSAT
jgi:ubiquinone/menaquinone biosynthesis C-methylase UbiE